MTDQKKRTMIKTVALSALASAVLIGCGKKEEPAPAPAPAQCRTCRMSMRFRATLPVRPVPNPNWCCRSGTAPEPCLAFWILTATPPPPSAKPMKTGWCRCWPKFSRMQNERQLPLRPSPLHA